MHDREERGGNLAAMDLRGVVVWLRVVAMNLRDAARFDVAFEQFVPTEDDELQVRQSALVAAFAGVANDHGQDVGAEVIVRASPERTADGEPPVPATDVQYDGCRAAKQRGPVQSAVFGHRLQCGLRPLQRRQDRPWERHAEFSFHSR